MNAKYLFLYDDVSMSNRKINISLTSVSVQYSDGNTYIVILKEILIFTIWFYFYFHCEKPMQLHMVFFIEISKRVCKRGFIVV